MNKLFKIGAFWLIFGLLCVNIQAQTEQTRTIEKSFPGKTALWAAHRYGDIVMKKGSGNQIKAVLKIRAAGNDADELKQFLNEFELKSSEAADNKIDIKTSDFIESWNQTKVIGVMRSTIKLRNGKTFDGITKFDMRLELYVPKLRYATLENKYDGIRVEEGTTNILIVKLYDGELNVAGTYEKLNLEMKYSEGIAGDFNTSEMELYDSDLRIGDGNILNMKSKYSEVQIGSLQELTLDSYDDNYEISGILGSARITDKYSEFTLRKIGGEMEFNFYDSEVEFTGDANVVTISESKYTEFDFLDVETLRINRSYDDKFEMNKVGTVEIGESKYTEYEIATLLKRLTINSHDDEVDVRYVDPGFEAFTFEGKYTDVELPIPTSVKYEIDAYAKYGEIDFPENQLEAGILKEKNSEITVQGKLKGAGPDAPKVTINAHDCNIDLN
jgi:hypothetical protein